MRSWRGQNWPWHNWQQWSSSSADSVYINVTSDTTDFSHYPAAPAIDEPKDDGPLAWLRRQTEEITALAH